MAPLTKLIEGTRVRTKVPSKTNMGYPIPVGKKGTVAYYWKYNDILREDIYIWIQWDPPTHGHVGNWVPYRALAILKGR